MKKPYAILMILCLAVLGACEKKEKNRCLDFKTGTFRFVDPKFKQFKIIRNRDVQIEIDSITGLTITGDVEWTSECSYRVTYNKVSDERYSSVIGASSNIKILAVFDETITVKSEGLGGTMEVELVRVAR